MHVARRCLGPMLLIAASLGAQTGESLRIGSYNTFLRSPQMYCAQSPENFLDCLNHYSEVPEANAHQAAAELLELDLDVIVLSEVFDETARHVLLSAMEQAGYHHQVEKIDDEMVIIEVDEDEVVVEVNLEDSGLMLFSRFPFVALPEPDYRWKPDYLDATTDEVAFIRFSQLAMPDALAAKGAGLVRIQNPSSGRIYTVVFTHLQADYGGESYPHFRQSQFEEMEKLITTTLGAADLGMQDIFLVGDLNVRGEGGLINGTSHNGSSGIPATEWVDRFGSGFFFGEMVDAWASQTSREDLGFTNAGDGGQRLDYVVSSRDPLEGRMCIQHLTREQIANSDHWLVVADYNIGRRLCNPRRAWIQPPFDQFLGWQLVPGQDVTRIASPGSAQWFRVALPNDDSTVSIALGSGQDYDPDADSGVIFELYDPTDLSKPIRQYDEVPVDLAGVGLDVPRGTRGTTYVVPSRFFIKVSSPNRAWTGDYSLLIHPHTCTSPVDPCILLPARPVTFDEFQPNVLHGPDDEAWFRFRVDTADSGDAQRLRVFVDGQQIESNFVAEVRDPADSQQPHPDYPAFDGQGDSLTVDSEIAQGSDGLFLVKRTNPAYGTPLKLGWQTNLTYLHGTTDGATGSLELRLFCLDETNPELGSDEIRLQMSVDGAPFKTVFDKEYECNDGDVSYPVESEVGTVRFLDRVSFRVAEDDDYSLTSTVESLHPNDAGSTNRFIEWSFLGGKYRLEFTVSRSLNGGS